MSTAQTPSDNTGLEEKLATLKARADELNTQMRLDIQELLQISQEVRAVSLVLGNAAKVTEMDQKIERLTRELQTAS